MTLQFYRLIHFIGMFMTFSVLGAILLHTMNGGTRLTNKSRKWAGIIHGVGLFLVLLGGFGALARLGMTDGIPMWAYAKLVIWLIFGAGLTLAYRLAKLSYVLWIGFVALGGVAAYIGAMKPF